MCPRDASPSRMAPIGSRLALKKPAALSSRTRPLGPCLTGLRTDERLLSDSSAKESLACLTRPTMRATSSAVPLTSTRPPPGNWLFASAIKVRLPICSFYLSLLLLIWIPHYTHICYRYPRAGRAVGVPEICPCEGMRQGAPQLHTQIGCRRSSTCVLIAGGTHSYRWTLRCPDKYGAFGRKEQMTEIRVPTQADGRISNPP